MEKKIIKSNPIAKKEIKKESIKNESLKKINLNQFKESLEKIEIKERNQKESIYKYPESFNKDMINSDKGKSWRNNKRNQLKSICNNILFYAKGNNQESLLKEISKFNSFYKEFYLKNDYSILSLSSSKEEKKIKDISLSLQIIKECMK